MKNLKLVVAVFGMLLISVDFVFAALVVQVAQPKISGTKAVIHLDLQNTYTNNIHSARAAVFLLNDQGKVVGQSTSWIIGGGKDKPALQPNAKTTYNFVISTDRPFIKTKLMVERILFDNGKLANALTDVQITDEGK